MKVKNLIIGAGVSGLSFASQSEDYLIVEKESSAGGLCRTIQRNGYTWDYSGHFFHFQNQKIKDFFLKSIPEEDLIYKEKNTKIYRKGRYIDFPFQKNIHQLDKQDFIDCLYDLYFKEEKKEYSDFLDMLYGKFGKNITEMFLRPYNEKLYACDLNILETDAMGRFFPYANIDEIIQNMKKTNNESYNGSFLYPRNGAQSFINILLNEVDQDRLLLNTEITKINLEEKKAYFGNSEVEFENLINTIPFNKFCKMLNIETFQSLSSNKVLVFNLGFDKKSAIDDIHWIYYPEKKYNFYRIGFYDNILDEDKLSMYVEIGFDENSNIDVDSELKKTLEGLKDIGIIKGLKLIDYEPIVMDPAYVHISEESERQKATIIKQLKNKNVYSIGRYGEWKYCSIEDCIVDAFALTGLLS